MYDRQQVYFTMLLKEARVLAIASADNDAIKLCEWAQANVHLIKNMQGNAENKVNSSVNAGYVYLRLVSVTDGWNADADSPIKRFSQNPYYARTYGEHYRSTHTIYMPMDWPLSVRWQAFTFLHECSHAYDYRMGKPGRPMSHFRSEMRAQRVDAVLLHGMNQQGYAFIMKDPRLKPVLQKYLDDTGDLTSWRLGENLIDDKILDQAFGSVFSPLDYGYRRTVVSRAIVQEFMQLFGGHINAGS